MSLHRAAHALSYAVPNEQEQLWCSTGGAWLAHKVVPPWAFSPTLLLNFVLLVAVGGAIFCHAISKPKRPRPTTAGAPGAC